MKLFIRVHLCSSVVSFLLWFSRAFPQELPYIKKPTRPETLQASTQAMAKAFAPAELKQTPWKIIGPFDNTDRRGETAAYPPERELNFQAEYIGRGGEKVRWRDAPEFADGKAHSLLPFATPSGDGTVCLYR